MIGVEIEGRYRVESELGAGGVGTVYRAVHLKLDRHVALKVIQERFGKSRELLQRFEREARALAALSHPHIITVTDYGVHDEMPYLVMELLEGSTLDALLREGPLEPDLALHIARQLLSALEFSHDTGLVHRDVKPSNVFLQSVPGARPHVKLLDFGLARFLDPGAHRGLVTRAGQVVGTPAYMAPEQIGGGGPTPGTDVYSAGIVLFEMLAGRPPFDGDAQEILRQHLLVSLPALGAVCGGRVASPELAALLVRATAKRPAERFAHAGEMARALDALPEPAVLAAPDAPAGDAARDAPAAPDPPPSRHPLRRASHVLWRAVVTLVVMVSLVALLGALSVVLVLSDPEIPNRYPRFHAGLRQLPGLGHLIPEREPAATEPRESSLSADVPEALAVASASAAPPEPDPLAAAPSAPAPVKAPTMPPPASPRGPPLWSKIPRALARYRRTVETSRPLTKKETTAVHQYNAAHVEDPRGHLILARSHLRQGWRRDAFNAYRGAHKTSPRAREDPHMLPDLIGLVAHGVRDAPAFVTEVYGRDALAAVEQALRLRQPTSAARERLQGLREELEAL
jgi:eukaryotic-like serine/threonine-protein kinase